MCSAIQRECAGYSWLASASPPSRFILWPTTSRPWPPSSTGTSLSPAARRSGEVRKLAGWDVPSAHNGYLEIWLDLGICGLAAFFLGFARHFRKAVQCFVREGLWEAAWPLLFLIFLFFVNLAQSALLSPNYVLWILYVAISCRVCLVTARPSEEGAR